MNEPLTLRANLRALPRAAWILYAGTFINRFGSFVMVFLVAWMTGRGYSPGQAGLAIGAYGTGNLCASLLGGYLADRIGRRSTIVLSMFSAAVATMALSQASALPAILGLAALTGLTAELYRPASSALLADCTPQGSRVTAYAVYRLAVNAGFAAGPAVAGFLAQHSWFWLFAGDAITSAIYGFIALVALPDPRGSVKVENHTRDLVRSIARDRTFQRFLIASVLATMVFFQFESTFPMQVLSLGFKSSTYGLLVSLNGLLIVIFELALTSFTQRHEPRRILAFGFTLVGIGFAVNAFASTIPVLIMSVVLWTFGEIISSPVGSAYVADLAPAHLRGGYMGAWGFTWSLGLILGPVLGSQLFQINQRALWLTCFAVGLASAWLVLGKAEGRKQKAEVRPASS